MMSAVAKMTLRYISGRLCPNWHTVNVWYGRLPRGDLPAGASAALERDVVDLLPPREPELRPRARRHAAASAVGVAVERVVRGLLRARLERLLHAVEARAEA